MLVLKYACPTSQKSNMTTTHTSIWKKEKIKITSWVSQIHVPAKEIQIPKERKIHTHPLESSTQCLLLFVSATYCCSPSKKRYPHFWKSMCFKISQKNDVIIQSDLLRTACAIHVIHSMFKEKIYRSVINDLYRVDYSDMMLKRNWTTHSVS